MIQVSIGIPFYNAQDFLEQAILSVLNQDYKSFELLLIDDGSTDKSLDIAYRFQDERIKVIHDGQNKGLSARLNELVALSKGEYFDLKCNSTPMLYSSFYHGKAFLVRSKSIR